MKSDEPERAKAPHYLIQFFTYAHLPFELQFVSRYFAELAERVDETLPENPEKSACLRSLLVAKDCAVRALLFVQPDREK